mmetsp:Transcript_35627/g.57235  ORF Transcript_35627/g.57235 Transcript_35627/m.57235 type:complete len:257 (+) Transcript_35627:275-1045(+)
MGCTCSRSSSNKTKFISPFTEKELREIESIFNHVDIDQTGIIDSQELKHTFREDKVQTPAHIRRIKIRNGRKDPVRELFKALKPLQACNNDGKITLEIWNRAFEDIYYDKGTKRKFRTWMRTLFVTMTPEESAAASSAFHTLVKLQNATILEKVQNRRLCSALNFDMRKLQVGGKVSIKFFLLSCIQFKKDGGDLKDLLLQHGTKGVTGQDFAKPFTKKEMKLIFRIFSFADSEHEGFVTSDKVAIRLTSKGGYFH